MSGYTAREKARSQRSLICLVQALKGMTVTIELKDDSIVTGCVEHVDGFMSVEMKDAQLKPINSDLVENLEKFFVHGKSIRYVQIPDHVDMVALMERQLRRGSDREHRAAALRDIQSAKRIRDRVRNRQAEKAKQKEQKKSSQ